MNASSKDIISRFLNKYGYERFSPRAALVDMDGTLYDSMPNHADAWMRVAREYGLRAERKEFFRFEGRTGASAIDILVRRQHGRPATEEEKVELYRKKTEYFRALPDVRPMPGAQSLMDQIRQMGLTRVLVTGSGQSSLLNRLDTDYPGIFPHSLRVTSANVTKGKPHPEPYLKAMDMAGVEPWESVVIENAPLGVESGAAAGAFTVAVTTGPIPAEEMIAAGASVIYSSMEECAKLLPQLLLSQEP